MRIGFVGLGAMGRGMAGTLLSAGHEVAGFDINPDALDWLEGKGGTRAANAAQACDGADAAILMVVNAGQAEAVLFGDGGVAEGLNGGALVLSSVTMPADAAQSLGARVEEAGLYYLDAPVSGGVVGAEGGALTFMAAGSDTAWNAAQPLLDAMGRDVFRFGDRPGPGSTMKMVHQLAAGCNLAVAAEVMSFGADQGLDPAKVLEVLNVSAGGSWMIANRGPRMLTEGVEANSAVDIFVKDLGIVLDAARAARFPVPISASALQVFLGASGAGFGGHDDSQATRFYEHLGGKKVRN
jgi:putative dehydrogenase